MQSVKLLDSTPSLVRKSQCRLTVHEVNMREPNVNHAMKCSIAFVK